VLRFVGSGPLKHELESTAQQLALQDCVEIADPVTSSQIWREIQHARALVLPSLFDGWGAVVNEAVGAGIPVLVSEAAGSSEIVAAHHCGTTFPPSDTASIASALIEVVSDEMVRNWSIRAYNARLRLSAGSAAAYLVEAIAALCDKRNAPLAPPWRTAIHVPDERLQTRLETRQ
jgi:glycosyltransferase involved in cell wall biosynthesis